ncbi:MAG: hypothetical protein ACM3PU_08490 [Gemmatimonadota bacterium]
MRANADNLLPIGTPIIAVKDVGRVRKGAPGFVTGVVRTPLFLPSGLSYLCTFADNLKVAMRPGEVDVFEHGYPLTRLEDPHGLTFDELLNPPKK